MSKNPTSILGITGVALFIVASILGGFQFDDYDPISQYISESYAVDTPYGKLLRFFGYIPSGILLAVFAFSAIKYFPVSRLIRIGFSGIAVFYGMATAVVGIFPCDKGCNLELVDPSTSQLIHNLTGLLTYTFVPFSILAIGMGLRKLKTHLRLSGIAFACALNAIVFISILFSDPHSNYAGLIQRIIEGTFIIWIIVCSLFIKNSNQLSSN